MTRCKRAVSGIKFGIVKENIFLCTTAKPCSRKIDKFMCKNPELESVMKDCPMKNGSGEPNAQGGITKTVPTNCRMKGCFGQAPMSEDKMKVCKFYQDNVGE